MAIPMYKVAWMDSGDTNNLYSRFFDTESEAREYERNMEGSKEALIFKKVTEEPNYYEWKLLSSKTAKKFKLANFIVSPIFIVPIVLGIILFVFLRRNNGLPKVIG